jgi:acetylornithine deacetylase/succinyl-diaminopimelate desuccinylase-like protein
MLKPTLATAALLALTIGVPAQQPALSPADRTLAHDIFKQLIETNTSHSVGSTTVAAEAMRKRFLDAGFPAKDMVIMGADDRHGNLVLRYHGKPGSTLKPVLIIGHIDVVEAKREDWTTDPFKFVEKDGFYYGRGTQDMKCSDAAYVTALIMLRRQGFVPDRDIILALTADEEGGTMNGVDWLIRHHRELIDAGFAINPDAGGLTTEHGKPS